MKSSHENRKFVCVKHGNKRKSFHIILLTMFSDHAGTKFSETFNSAYTVATVSLT